MLIIIYIIYNIIYYNIIHNNKKYCWNIINCTLFIWVWLTVDYVQTTDTTGPLQYIRIYKNIWIITRNDIKMFWTFSWGNIGPISICIIPLLYSALFWNINTKMPPHAFASSLNVSNKRQVQHCVTLTSSVVVVHNGS